MLSLPPKPSVPNGRHQDQDNDEDDYTEDEEEGAPGKDVRMDEKPQEIQEMKQSSEPKQEPFNPPDNDIQEPEEDEDGYSNEDFD